MPSYLKIILLGMDMLFLVTGLALFIGGVYIINEFANAQALLAPEAAEGQSLVGLVGVAVVGVIMSLGSVFGGYGVVQSSDLWIVFSSSLMAPCFATLFSLGVCLLVYENALFDIIMATLQYETTKNISTGLLLTGNARYGCCGISNLGGGCDRNYPPTSACSAGSSGCKRGCSAAVWNRLFIPYLNGTVSAFLTISAILLGSLIISVFVYKSIVKEKAQQRKEDAIALSNRGVKQD